MQSTKLKKLKRLYKKIPNMKCKNCGKCCGIVPFIKLEWARVENKKKATNLNCPYLSKNGCEIYELRPFMCRLFGTSIDPRLKCPNGCAPDKILSAEEARELTNKYKSL